MLLCNCTFENVFKTSTKTFKDEKQSPESVSYNKEVLKNSRSSKENIYAGVSFLNKVIGCSPTTLLKRGSGKGVFMRILPFL